MSQFYFIYGLLNNPVSASYFTELSSTMTGDKEFEKMLKNVAAG
jgi:hypothetical protein